MTITRKHRDRWLLTSVLVMLALVYMAYVEYYYMVYPLNIVFAAILLALLAPTAWLIYRFLTADVAEEGDPPLQS